MTLPSPESKPVKKENPLLSLAVNIAIPSLVLMKLSREDRLGATVGLLVALAFPVTYLIVDFYRSRKTNFISVLGLVSILLTGGIGLMKLQAHWIAVKEAAVPGIIGCVILGSMRTKFPLVKKLLYNDTIFDCRRIEEALAGQSKEIAFDGLMARSSYVVAASFFLSSALNYGLAKYILHSDPGSVTFNEELGKMTALSWPVIVVPSMLVMMLALWQLLHGIKKLTGLELEQIFHGQEKK